MQIWDYESLNIGRNSDSRKLLHKTSGLVILFSLLGSGITYNIPANSIMGDYLYLSTSIYINGFLSNNMKVKYNHNSFPIRSYFALLPNHREQKPSTYHNSNLVYETRGVAVDWRNTGMVLTERIPSNFFYLTEVHYGGGGCYTSSDRWNEANGTAIGLL